jgi:CDP-4-dehydro-6-deoxyglucose reductase, E1
MSAQNSKAEIRKKILSLVNDYYAAEKAEMPKFVPGISRINTGGRIYDEKELVNLVDSSLDFWLTAGQYAQRFEAAFSGKIGLGYCSLTNSGSSANLLALSALTSKAVTGCLREGDEVITAAAGFPTTVNPIFQCGLTPVFVDVDLGSYNVNPKIVEQAITDKTKAIFLAHSLGNPFDAEYLAEISKERGIWLIEDCCDALGSTFNGQNVGTFGSLSTYSFYPAHHITMGEGGAILTNDTTLNKEVNSFRDWGRDCYCSTGFDDTCGKRFSWQLGNLPFGYDHKYIYSNIGYNLKALDMQAAIGLAQLDKLDDFIERRRANYFLILEKLKKFEDLLILPQVDPKAYISPFGFPLTVRSDAGFTRRDIVTFLEAKGVATRMLFGGNLTRQPAYLGKKYRVFGGLENSDIVMNSFFWIGVYPGIDETMLMYVCKVFDEFMALHAKS